MVRRVGREVDRMNAAGYEYHTHTQSSKLNSPKVSFEIIVNIQFGNWPNLLIFVFLLEGINLKF